MRKINTISATQFLAVFVLAYFIIGMIGGIIGFEIFPFYSWSLYSKVPNEKTEYALLLHQYHGKNLSPPIFYFNAQKIISQTEWYVPYENIQEMGKARAKNDSIKEKMIRDIFEKNFLTPPARYELVRITYHPLRLRSSGEIIRMSRISNYTSGE